MPNPVSEEEDIDPDPVLFNDSSSLFISPCKREDGGGWVRRQVTRPAWQGCRKPRSKAEMRTDRVCAVCGVELQG